MMPDNSDNNSLAASLIVEELVRNNVTRFCISPGSRSTPLTAAAARNRLVEKTTHYDERGAGFFALGYAKARNRPVALICTSGTAAANYLPAVVEASMDMVPLILLTADRPPELRDTGANQTITQAGMFNNYVRWQIDLPCPDDPLDPAFWLTTVDQAVCRALRSPAGPVHLNCMFREPLEPLIDKEPLANTSSVIRRWKQSAKMFTTYSLPASEPGNEDLNDLADILQESKNGLLITGALRNSEDQEAVTHLSDRLGWLTLPDIQSGLRLGGSGEQIAHYYDLLMQTDRFLVNLQPDVILQIGRRPVSKRLMQKIEFMTPDEYIFVDHHPFRHDPLHRLSRRVESNIACFCNLMLSRLGGHHTETQRDLPPNASAIIDRILDDLLSEGDSLREPVITRLLSKHLPPGSNLFLGNSMPIRLMDMYGCHESDVFVAANRGASGIDGTVASASGYASGSDRRTTLLIGDLALLHDLTSLELTDKTSVPIVIVVLNNNGGGIFDLLPVAQCDDIFEEFFIQPHGRTFEKAAAMYNLAYTKPETLDSFVESLKKASSGHESWLIEVEIDRNESLSIHALVRERIRKALA